MDEQRLRGMLDAACRFGEDHSLQAIRSANEVWRLRGAIRRALRLLRAGQIAKAREVLEQQIIRKKHG